MSDFVKVLDYPSINSRGEQTLRFVTPTVQRSMIKTADMMAFAPKIREMVQSIKSTAGKVYALINAMGAAEFYSSNINGDAFYEDALKKHHHTFVDNGMPYMYHANKDPNKAYGKVIASDYNDIMHRVELIVEYDTEKLDKKYVEKINNGELVQVSMGCRVPYDLCSICGNRAKSPQNYCSHLKDSPGLGRLLPDGRKAFAINTLPEFFDISIVTIPADPTARVMMKIASSGQVVTSSSDRAREMLNIKSAEILADTETERKKKAADEANSKSGPAIQGLLKAIEGAFGPPIERSTLNSIGEDSDDIFSTLKSFISNKMFLRPQEVQRIVLVAGGHGEAADALDEHKMLLGNSPDPVMSRMNSAEGDCCCDQLGEDVREERSMEPGNVKRVIIRMFLPMDKTASLEEVPVSDDYRLLMGERQMRDELPNVMSDPLEAIKAYLMAGSIVAAFNQLLGQEVTPALMGGTAAVSAVAGPQLLGILNDIPRAVSAPSQMMNFKSEHDPDVIRQAILSALVSSSNKTAGVKTANPFGINSLMALPLAYGASKLIEHEAKNSAMEDAKYTGKYDPGLMAKPEITLPLSLALALKFASAKNKINSYVKMAEASLRRPFIDILNKNKSEVYHSIEKFLFK